MTAYEGHGSHGIRTGAAGNVARALPHEIKNLPRASGSELLILVEYEREDIFSESVSMAVEKVLSCLTDPATPVLD